MEKLYSQPSAFTKPQGTFLRLSHAVIMDRASFTMPIPPFSEQPEQNNRPLSQKKCCRHFQAHRHNDAPWPSQRYHYKHRQCSTTQLWARKLSSVAYCRLLATGKSLRNLWHTFLVIHKELSTITAEYMPMHVEPFPWFLSSSDPSRSCQFWGDIWHIDSHIITRRVRVLTSEGSRKRVHHWWSICIHRAAKEQ